MPVVTKVERQKNNKKRVSVFADGEYAFSLYDETAVLNGIEKGRELNNAVIKKVMNDDNYKYALELSFKHMSASEKSEKQMRDFLLKKEITPENVQKAVDRLKELGYIDDVNFAKMFIQSHKKSGRRAVIFKLREKGIDSRVIDELDEMMSDSIQEENAFMLAQRYLKKYSAFDEAVKKRKICEALVRRGFDWDVSAEAAQRALETEDDT